jgi:Spy/CpxP family protein refolding chaperone
MSTPRVQHPCGRPELFDIIEKGEAAMIRYIGIALIGLLIFAPAGAQAQDSLDALISKLNLEQTQIDKIRLLFDEFTKKQDKLPTAVDEAMKHRKTIRQVITKAPFNRDEAQQVSQEVASIVAQRMVNRLELRNQIFHVLSSKQQQQYIQYVEQNLGTSE